MNDQLIYTIPCYKTNITGVCIQHFFHLENIEFIYENVYNDLKNIYKMKITCLFNKKKNNWNKFIKNNNLNKVLIKSSNKNKNPEHSISLYIRNPNNIVTYNERHGTAEKKFNIYDQKATILFRMYMVNFNKQFFFINELYGICYKN